jgi:hypothetical protein
VYPLLKLLETSIPYWVRPTNQSLVLCTVADLTRGRSELVLENAYLRQQMIVLSREKKRPSLTNRDRRLLVLLACWLPSWKNVLMIVQPDTLIRWHRDLFRTVWRQKGSCSNWALRSANARCADLRCVLPGRFRVCDHRIGAPEGHSLQCDTVSLRCVGSPAVM